VEAEATRGLKQIMRRLAEDGHPVPAGRAVNNRKNYVRSD
jgi:hypothetical protein